MGSKWIDGGRVFAPEDGPRWGRQAVMTPTPILLPGGEVIRIFCSFLDEETRGRIGFVDVRADDPSHILQISKTPVLDIGGAGAFDDNGLVLGEVVSLGGTRWRMYYVGFQKIARAKFLAFSGAAESENGVENFSRLSPAPVIDRAVESTLFRCIHCVLPESDGFRIWYTRGLGWRTIDGKPYPSYETATQYSPDGLTFAARGETCLSPQGDEYRLGRLRVWREKHGGLRGLCTVGDLRGGYLAHRASCAPNGQWRREGLWLPPSGKAGDWNSDSVCYPAVLRLDGQLVAFYNGNGMGKTGFGWAQQKEQVASGAL